MDGIQIQMQDPSGNWRTYSLTTNFPTQIRMEMENLKRQFPDARVRAADMNGRLIDILI
jgi:hypothetical protein